MSEDPKIIVDEDWKSQVQAEKEAAKSAGEESPEQPAGGSAANKSPAEQTERFSMLVSSLATQALMALGQFPDPNTGHPVVRPDAAKAVIDTLSMLEAKTQGNLSGEEAQMLENVLHELRMMFLAIRKAPPEQSSSKSPDNPAAAPDDTGTPETG